MSGPVFESPLVRVFHGDCMEVMRGMPDGSVHAVVTDPPYGIGFMGHEWDQPGEFGPQWGNGKPGVHNRVGHYDHRKSTAREGAMEAGRYDLSAAANQRFAAWVEAWARECFRLLKPGGHLLSFGGSRTWHRLAAGIEDAGFEMRDSIAWLYGSGFPKSLDVSKAIDKVRDDTSDIRKVCRFLRARIDEHPAETVRTIAERFGFHPRMVEHWAARDTDSQPTVPTLVQWEQLRGALAFGDDVDADVARLNERKGEFGESWQERPVTGELEEWRDRTNYALTARDGLRRDEPASDAAKAWQGWGTALKPAFEPIVVARKPLVGTVAANVLAHGTGALNIDGNRIHSEGSEAKPYTVKRLKPGATLNRTGGNWRPEEDDAPTYEGETKAGRWPSNVVLDESQAAELDRQSGVLTSGANPTRRSSDKFRDAYGDFKGQQEIEPARGVDSGGASRFFPTFRYEAKAPGHERPRDGEVAHPTVKPIDLMRWLVRLVTPPGGVVLDPFAGSGTTAEACLREGFECVVIEREAEYLPLILKRVRKDHEQSLFGDWDAS